MTAKVDREIIKIVGKKELMQILQHSKKICQQYVLNV
jgi:hypothetical protein